MPKRRKAPRYPDSGGSVTGGTKDIKPQVLVVSTPVQPAINQYTLATLNVPVPRFGPSAKRATVMEILKVKFYVRNQDFADVGGIYWGFLNGNTTRTSALACSTTTMMEDIGDHLTLSIGRWVGAAGMGHEDGWQDMTDSNGNGILVATDRLSFVAGSVSATLVQTYCVRILYRLVNIPIAEYVGIVQSQSM